MKCPVCSVELKMADRQGVEIDYCPECRGVWLDRGELDKLIERSATYTERREEDSRPRERREEHGEYRREGEYREDEYHRRKRRKGFLGELFDFD